MKVYNKRSASSVPNGARYVGRPTPFGNLFTHLASDTLAIARVATRQDSVDYYEAVAFHPTAQKTFDILSQFSDEQVAQIVVHSEWIRNHVADLRGFDLVCWCAPHACHGDVLLRYANVD